MISINHVVYGIENIEVNRSPQYHSWNRSSCELWVGLSELQSVPSLFIQTHEYSVAIPISDLETIIASRVSRNF